MLRLNQNGRLKIMSSERMIRARWQSRSPGLCKEESLEVGALKDRMTGKAMSYKERETGKTLSYKDYPYEGSEFQKARRNEPATVHRVHTLRSFYRH